MAHPKCPCAHSHPPFICSAWDPPKPRLRQGGAPGEADLEVPLVSPGRALGLDGLQPRGELAEGRGCRKESVGRRHRRGPGSRRARPGQCAWLCSDREPGDRSGVAEDPGEGLARPTPSALLLPWCSGGTSSVASCKQPQRELTGRVISGECGGEKIIRFLSLLKFF